MVLFHSYGMTHGSGGLLAIERLFRNVWTTECKALTVCLAPRVMRSHELSLACLASEKMFLYASSQGNRYPSEKSWTMSSRSCCKLSVPASWKVILLRSMTFHSMVDRVYIGQRLTPKYPKYVWITTLIIAVATIGQVWGRRRWLQHQLRAWPRKICPIESIDIWLWINTYTYYF